MSLAHKQTDPYGAGRPSPIATPPGAGRGEPIPAPGGAPGLPHYLKPIPINNRSISALIRSHITAVEPRLQRWLYSTWTANREAMKYQEIRNAIRDGDLAPDWLPKWQAEYTKLINEKIAPQWQRTMLTASGQLATQGARSGLPLRFGAQAVNVQRWIQARGGELIVDLTSSQYQAVRQVLQHHIVRDPIPPAQLARLLRPMVGLTPGQTRAVTRYRAALVEQGLPVKSVEHLTQNYSGYLHRVRATRIARTEVAFAYNNGMLETVRQSQDAGDLRGEVVKTFYAAEDERMCDFCGALHGETVGIDETFPGVTRRIPNLLMPPVHPGCRCVVIFGLIE